MVGERLAEIRKNYGDTQKELAQKLHVSMATVRSWEQNRSDPSHEMLVAICHCYRVSADFLLGISNIDPVYERRRTSCLSDQEINELRLFESFLLYKRKEAER